MPGDMQVRRPAVASLLNLILALGVGPVLILLSEQVQSNLMRAVCFLTGISALVFLDCHRHQSRVGGRYAALDTELTKGLHSSSNPIHFESVTRSHSAGCNHWPAGKYTLLSSRLYFAIMRASRRSANPWMSASCTFKPNPLCACFNRDTRR
jgi:hypothetical protein